MGFSPNGGGGVFPRPPVDVNWPSNFCHGKIILRCWNMFYRSKLLHLFAFFWCIWQLCRAVLESTGQQIWHKIGCLANLASAPGILLWRRICKHWKPERQNIFNIKWQVIFIFFHISVICKRLQVYFIKKTGEICKSQLYGYRGALPWNNDENPILNNVQKGNINKN